MPVTRPSHQALKGRANAQIAPTTNRTPITACAHRQVRRIDAIRNSLNAPSRNRTPIRTPTVLTEAGVNRSTITAMISHAMPVTRNSHHGPASRHSAARVFGLMPVRPSAASGLMLICGSLLHQTCYVGKAAGCLRAGAEFSSRGNGNGMGRDVQLPGLLEAGA